MTTELTITSSDGTRIAAYDHGGPAEAPTVLLVHGWPDDHSLWDEVVPLLTPRFRVVTMDARGAGASQAPKGRKGYRLDLLADDVAAVAEVASPDRPVHLLGHDWGSSTCWQFVTRAGAPVRSFTSISGPQLDRAGQWLRQGGRDAARQLAHSWYMLAFQVPVLPELAIRTGAMDKVVGLVVGKDAPRPSGGHAEMANGLNIYRANLLAALTSKAEDKTTEVPVQVLTPLDDPAVTPQWQIGAATPAASDLRVRAIPGSHWVPRSHPKVIAELTTSFVEEIEARTR